MYAQAVLHIFNAQTVQTFAQTAWDLIKPGGLFIGANSSSDPPGIFGAQISGDASQAPWLHSPATFKSMLEQCGYVDVKVETSTFPDFIRRRGFGKQFWDVDLIKPFGDDRLLIWLTWSAKKPNNQASTSATEAL